MRDCEAEQCAATAQTVVDEVEDRVVVRRREGRVCAAPHGEALSAPREQREPLQAIVPRDALVVPAPAVAIAPPVQAKHAPARVLRHECAHCCVQRRIPQRTLYLVVHHRAATPSARRWLRAPSCTSSGICR